MLLHGAVALLVTFLLSASVTKGDQLLCSVFDIIIKSKCSQ